jgi:predicted GIY-YIG superfamily endonuclease
MKTSLYRHFEKDGTLLYVGISLNHVVRLSQHKAASSWFEKIATVTIEQFETRAEALQAETKAVVNEKPLHNIQKQGEPEPPPNEFEDARRGITFRVVALHPLYTLQQAGQLLDLNGKTIKHLTDTGVLGTIVIPARTDRLTIHGTPYKDKTYITGWQILDCLEVLSEVKK